MLSASSLITAETPMTPVTGSSFARALRTGAVATLLGSPLACITFPRAASAQKTTASLCRPADALTTELMASLKGTLSSTEEEAAAWRNTVGISAVDTSQTAVITDATICQAAANQVELDIKADNPTYAAPTPSRRSVYVVRVGQVYGVVDPNVKLGEWRRAHLMTYASKRFTSKTKVLW